jgi:hypothetical protein
MCCRQPFKSTDSILTQLTEAQIVNCSSMHFSSLNRHIFGSWFSSHVEDFSDREGANTEGPTITYPGNAAGHKVVV